MKTVLLVIVGLVIIACCILGTYYKVQTPFGTVHGFWFWLAIIPCIGITDSLLDRQQS